MWMIRSGIELSATSQARNLEISLAGPPVREERLQPRRFAESGGIPIVAIAEENVTFEKFD